MTRKGMVALKVPSGSLIAGRPTILKIVRLMSIFGLKIGVVETYCDFRSIIGSGDGCSKLKSRRMAKISTFISRTAIR